MKSGRRGFLGLFGGAVAAGVVAAKAEPIAPAPVPVAPIVAKVATPPMPEYLRYMAPDPWCVTSSASIMFYLPGTHTLNMGTAVNRGQRV